MSNPGKVTMRDIEMFVLLAQSKSVKETADQLGCKSKDVTERRQALEKKLGFKLIESKGPKISLTGDAERFFEHAALVHNAFRAGLASPDKRAFAEPKALRLVYIQSPTALFLPEALRKFKEAHPTVKIVESTPFADECVRRIGLGKAHVGLSIQPEPPIQEPVYEELVRYRFFCAVFKDHRLAKQSKVSLEEMQSECLQVMGAEATQYNRHLRALFEPVGGIKRHQRCEDFDSQLTKIAADHGIGVVLYPMRRLIGDRPIKLLPIWPDKFIGVGALWPRDVIPAAKDLVEAARAIIKVQIRKFGKNVSAPNPRGGFNK